MSKSKGTNLPTYLYYGLNMDSDSSNSEATGLVNPDALYQNKDDCWVADNKTSDLNQKAIVIITKLH